VRSSLRKRRPTLGHRRPRSWRRNLELGKNISEGTSLFGYSGNRHRACLVLVGGSADREEGGILLLNGLKTLESEWGIIYPQKQAGLFRGCWKTGQRGNYDTGTKMGLLAKPVRARNVRNPSKWRGGRKVNILSKKGPPFVDEGWREPLKMSTNPTNEALMG